MDMFVEESSVRTESLVPADPADKTLLCSEEHIEQKKIRTISEPCQAILASR